MNWMPPSPSPALTEHRVKGSDHLSNGLQYKRIPLRMRYYRSIMDAKAVNGKGETGAR